MAVKQHLQSERSKLIRQLYNPAEGRDREFLAELLGVSIRTVSAVLNEEQSKEEQPCSQ